MYVEELLTIACVSLEQGAADQEVSVLRRSWWAEASTQSTTLVGSSPSAILAQTL